MKKTSKTIKKKDVKEFLEKHHGKKVSNPYSPDYVYYYECNDNMLLIENTKLRQTWVELDREKFYEDQRNIQKWFKFDPFKLKQAEILDLTNHKQQLLDEFFDTLKLKRERSLSDINLDKVNKAIRTYGYEKAVENLYTNMIIFAGEYIKEKKGGDWIITKDIQSFDTNTYKPVLIDEKGKNYDFDLNVLLLKPFYEKRRINMRQLIEFALLPDLFQVEAPPRSMPPVKQK